ncbi:MAG: acetylxylan esterase [Spirosoma sp.]|nr:acetylxylan esterase [Spirosoma sp.]
MLKNVLLFAHFLVMSLLPARTQSVLPGGLPSAKFHLYILAGQSNMAGRGVPEMVDKTPHPRVWMLNKANQWVPATEPMHFDKPDRVGVGPGLAFGKLMAEQADTSVFIGLIPTAVGGSAIDAWQPGGYHDETKTHPYDEAVKRVQLAQKSGTLHGILWHQGESDSSPKLVTGYRQKLTGLIARFRREFEAPNLAVVVGTLGDFYAAKTPSASQINDILRSLPNHDRRIACIEATGLTDKGDSTHFDTASARELGRRYAAAMQHLNQKKR